MAYVPLNLFLCLSVDHHVIVDLRPQWHIRILLVPQPLNRHARF